MSRTLKARNLRIILAGVLALLIVGGYGLFTLGHKYLAEQAQATSEAATRADQSEKEQSNLAATKIELEKNQQAVSRASKIVAESKSYQYQNQITTDLYQLARKAGVEITGITFDTGSVKSGAAAATPAPQAGGAAGGVAAPTAPAAPVALPGIKPSTMTVTIKSPVPYEKVVNYVYLIEQNLTKIRVGDLSLTADQTAKGAVTSGALTLEVYLKQ